MSLRDFMKIEQDISDISAFKDKTQLVSGMEEDEFDPLVQSFRTDMTEQAEEKGGIQVLTDREKAWVR